MNQHPFTKPGRFYRGNLHTHSTRSDGGLSPEAVCQFYKDMGYDFLAITDHFMERFNYPITDTSPYRTDDFTTIFGAELHAGETSTGELWHILAVGLPLDFAPNLPDENGPQIAARALAAGAFVAVAHPAWYNLTEEDVISLGDVHAIETINGISADHNDRIDSWYMLDVMLARGRRYSACANDDAHFVDRHNDRVRGWVWVKSESLEPDALLAALKRGDYYSSTGPQIHDLQITDQQADDPLLARRLDLRHRQRTALGLQARQGDDRRGTRPEQIRQPLLSRDRPRPQRRPGMVEPDLVRGLRAKTPNAKAQREKERRKGVVFPLRLALILSVFALNLFYNSASRSWMARRRA